MESGANQNHAPLDLEDQKKFALQEHTALRAEALLRVAEVNSLERNLVIATGAVWVFLATHPMVGVERWAWAFPILFVFLAFLRARNDTRAFRLIGKYLQQVELLFREDGGWERFRADERKKMSRLSNAPYWFYLVLGVATTVVAFYEICWAAGGLPTSK